MQAGYEKVFKQNENCLPSPSQGDQSQTIRPPVNKFISRNANQHYPIYILLFSSNCKFSVKFENNNLAM